MKRKILLLATVAALLLMGIVAVPAGANPGTLYVDVNQSGDPLVANSLVCAGNVPCYAHPQDAVNAANPGDTILVYPGTYGERIYPISGPPFWSSLGDRSAPALIVWKDNLTIEAVDPNPANTVIQTTFDYWINQGGGTSGGAIQKATGCTWDPVNYWVGDCVRPAEGSAPNAVAIIASGVTVDGFTLRATGMVNNTAGVMIGGLCAGCAQFVGLADNNTVRNCAFDTSWHAIYVWHSSGNTIVENTVAALGNTGHWAGISLYDGYNNDQINLGHPSENNFIAYNTLADKGISIGAHAPSIWTSNAGTAVCHNTVNGPIGTYYTHGPVMVGCNTASYSLKNQTDKVLRIAPPTDYVMYTGPTGPIVGPADVTLSALLHFAGSATGSGLEVVFTVDGTLYSALTVGQTAVTATAQTAAHLGVGVHTIVTTYTMDACECVLSDTDTLEVVPAPTLSCPAGDYFVSAVGPGEGTPVVDVPVMDGFNYRVTASGTFYAGGGSQYDIQADAEWSQDAYQRVNGLDWTDLVRGYESYGEGLLELKVDGGFMEWGDFSPLHEYTVPVVASGDTMSFQIYDIYADNNTGGLCVGLALCESTPKTVSLLAGQTINAGTVSVWHDGENLYVDFAAMPNWQFAATHVQLFTSDSPFTGITLKNGNPPPGQFNYKNTYSPWVADPVPIVIPLPDAPGTYYIAAHADLKKVVNGRVVASETGWGEGKGFPGKNWAMYFDYTINVCETTN